MNGTSELRQTNASQTRISSDLEQMLRSQFLGQQERTPAESFPTLESAGAEDSIRQLTKTVRFAGGAYDPAIIRFYEDIIIELQKEVERYKALWATTLPNDGPAVTVSYVARQTVQLSQAMATKLKSTTKPSLRASEE